MTSIRSTWRVRLARKLCAKEVAIAEQRRGVAEQILLAVPEGWTTAQRIWERYTENQADREDQVAEILASMADNGVLERSKPSQAGPAFYRLRSER